MCFKKLLTTISVIFITTAGYSQDTSGYVLDNYSNPIEGANILIYNNKSKDQLLTYAITSKDGAFSIKNSFLKGDSFFIEVNHLTFNTYRGLRNKDEKAIEIVLSNKTETLQEVILERQKIKQLEDTITYNVDYFKKEQDRSIGDVMKRLPGIEVKSSGQILFQGEPIEKYYIEGLDLLEGRYNIANRNIKASDISEIQILENHQPIKVLDSLRYSNKSSLNLKLKKEYVKALVTKLAIGADPFLRDLELVPILLNKKQQFIGSLKSNNTGQDVKEDLTDFSSDVKEEILPLSSVIKPIPPPLLQTYWYDNDSHLATINYLTKLKNGAALKVNTSYYKNTFNDLASKTTTFFETNSSNTIIENIQNKTTTDNVSTGLTYDQNTKNIFLKNKLDINFSKDNIEGAITGTDNVNQRNHNKKITIDNTLKAIIKKKERLYEFTNTLGYSNIDAKLAVFNDTIQSYTLRTLNLKQDISTILQLGYWTYTPQLSISIKNQELNSSLQLPQTASLINDDRFLHNEYTFGNDFLFKRKGFVFNGRIPVQFFNLQANNGLSNKNQNLNLLTLSPRLFFSYKLPNKWQINTNATITNSFGDITGTYQNSILRNYRFSTQNDSLIQRTQQYNLGFQLQHKSILKGSFTRASFNKVFTRENFTILNEILPNGQVRYTAIERENPGEQHIVSINHSRSLYDLKTTVKLDLSWTSIANERLINSQLTDVNQNIYNSNLQIDYSGIKSLLFSYRLDFSHFELKQNTINQSDFNNSNHLITVSSIFKNHIISTSLNHYSLNSSITQTTSSIANLSYTYKVKKKKLTEVFFKINNITNQNFFETQSNDSFFRTTDNYTLRPRQVLIGSRFSF